MAPSGLSNRAATLRTIPARGTLLALALVVGIAVSHPATAACDLADGPTAKVARVVDGETLMLEDGRGVRLVGVLAPVAPRWWRKPEPWPPAEASRAALAALAEGQTVALAFGGAREDRRARRLAHVFVTRGAERLWAQAHLVGLGLARAVSFKDNRACARALQAREAEARAARRGLWSRRVYGVLAANDTAALLRRLQGYVLVEGRVAAVARRRRWTFLNFGADWKRDFTVAVAAGDRRRFAGSDVDLAALEGRRVRVRGWIESWNGPAIKATHPEQIELLDGAAEAAVPVAPSGGPNEKNAAPSAPSSR